MTNAHSNLYLGRQEWLNPVPAPYPITFNEVATRALITHEDKVLLVYEAHLDSWWLPGGRIRPGEDMLSGLLREIEEETALDVVPGDLAGLFDVIVPDTSRQASKHMFHFIFRAAPAQVPDFVERAHFDTDPDHPGKVTRLRWFTAEEVRALPRVFPAVLRDWPRLLADRPKAYYGTKNEDGAPAQFPIERFYISARSVTLHDDRVLMVRNRNQVYWYGAGGRIEYGESILEAAVREVAEEANVTAQADGVIAVDEFYSHTGRIHQINLYTSCRPCAPVGATAPQQQTDYVGEARFFSRAELAALPHAYPAYMAELAWPETAREGAA